MLKYRLLPVLMLVAAAAFAADHPDVQFAEGTDALATRLVGTYAGLPKGVVFEGTAEGIDALAAVTYDKEKNEFTINEKFTYKNPVSKKDWVQLFKSLKKDDRLGVTLLNGDPRVYGSLAAENEMVKNMVEADKLIGGIVYGLEHLLTEVKLPHGYKPKKAAARKVAVVAFANFNRYLFEKTGSTFARTGASLDINLIPLAEDKTDNGGHLPDKDKLKEYAMEESDRQNLDHIRTNQADYFKLPAFARCLAVGEAAAFARLIRDSKIDIEALLKQLK